VAARSPTQPHSYWGAGFASSAQLPNVAGSPLQRATLEDGDTAFIPSAGLLYVCTDATLGAAVWSAQAPDDATRVLHTPGLTTFRNVFPPGQGPQPVTIGTTVGLHYAADADLVYGYSKIQTSYVSDASFHVHWTKNVNTDQSGRVVRWLINYTVFNGSSQDVNVAPTGTLTLDSTYTDAGTTTRIVRRSPSAPAPGFIAGYYVSFSVGFDAANTTLDGRPTLVSCDILTRNTINLGN